MVAPVNISSLDHGAEGCPVVGGNFSDDNSTPKKPVGEFLWSPKVQGMLVGAFYYGYITSQMVGGWVAEVLGARWLFTLAVLASSAATLALPWAAPLGASATFGLRLGCGLAQGMAYTALYAAMGRWAPPRERASLLAVAMTGNQVGSILGMLATGFLCLNPGWRAPFVIFGSSGLLAAIMVFLVVYNEPVEHPRISPQELTYLTQNLPHISSGTEKKKTQIPWKSLLTSGPVWTLTVTKTCWTWGFYTMLTKLPMYLDQVLHIPITQNGVINASMYLTQSITGIVAGYLADLFLHRRVASITAIRKGFEAAALLGTAASTAVLPQLGCQQGAVIAVLVVALGCLGLNQGGDNPNVVDLAPDHAGTIFGISNGLSAITGILAPLVAGFLLEDQPGSITRWSTVFYLAAGLFAMGMVVFCAFGTAHVQPWSSAYIGEEKQATNGLQLK
ncbi:SLC17A2 [Cordylochernes scorpioides]|uniref:SLC17A2 n=1 Tax=Cordylochernes scorpioides TaxID=51811 RepID=A0ABY6K1E9_9ARAC|nr:SLC17A2 [Cordylochernes scorpioides]